MVKIATKNAPQRFGDGANDHDFQRFADRGNTVIAGQEIPSHLVRRFRPKGWRYHRGPARSEVIYWCPKTWEYLTRGATKISSPSGTERYALWVRLRHRKTGVVRRFACVHLVAFKTSNAKHAKEYRYQAAHLAVWIAKYERAVVLGDFNGSPKGHWLDPVMAVANVHTPPTHSGPEGQFIDLIVTNKKIAHAIKARALPGFHGDHKPVEAHLPLR